MTSWNRIEKLKVEIESATDKDAKKEALDEWMWYQFDGGEYMRHSNYGTLDRRKKDMWYDMVEDTVKMVKRNF